MKFLSSLTVALSGATIASAVSVPQPLSERSSDVGAVAREKSSFVKNIFEKRKGGGGRSSYSGGSSSSSGSSRAPNSLPSSNRGGVSSGGSGAPRLYGGRSFYGGGARKPFKAGSKSPSGLTPTIVPLAVLLTVFPGGWLYDAYEYDYEVTFLNETVGAKGENQTKPVACLCQFYGVCGCDSNTDQDYIDDIINEYQDGNDTLITVGTLKKQERILLNGSLPNGTTADSWATGSRQSLMEQASWGVVAVGIVGSLWLI